MITSFFKKSGVFSYLLALALLALAVYSQKELGGSLVRVEAEETIAFMLLSMCMLAVDWTVKQRYWADQANYHLLLFPLFIFAFPVSLWNNWMLIFLFFFWTAFTYLVAIDQSGGTIAKVFNAFFFFFIGTLFFPQGIVLLPLLWLVMMVKGVLNLQHFLISGFPVGALILLEVLLRYYMPNSILISSVNFSEVVFSIPLEEHLRFNLWWIILLIIFLFAVLKHYIDMATKSASYGAGIIALFISSATGLLFALAFQSQSHFAWIFFLMASTALSTRVFEGIKRAWLRELFFLGIIALLLVGKFGFPF